MERVAEIVEEQGKVITVEQAIELALDGEELDADEEQALMWMVAAYAELPWGVDAAELAAREEDDELPGGDELFPNGYEQIIRVLGDHQARALARQ